MKQKDLVLGAHYYADTHTDWDQHAPDKTNDVVLLDTRPIWYTDPNWRTRWSRNMVLDTESGKLAEYTDITVGGKALLVRDDRGRIETVGLGMLRGPFDAVMLELAKKEAVRKVVTDHTAQQEQAWQDEFAAMVQALAPYGLTPTIGYRVVKKHPQDFGYDVADNLAFPLEEARKLMALVTGKESV